MTQGSLQTASVAKEDLSTNIWIATNSFVQSLGTWYQTSTAKPNIFTLQLKLELDLIPAASHIRMVKVNICKSLTGIRMLIATRSNYLLSAALNTSSRDKLQYLNCLLPVVFQRKKNSLQIVSYKISNTNNYSIFAFLDFPPNSERGQLLKLDKLQQYSTSSCNYLVKYF